MIVATTLVTYDKPSCLTVEKKSVVWRKKKKKKEVGFRGAHLALLCCRHGCWCFD